jgi:hypothetical protein
MAAGVDCEVVHPIGKVEKELSGVPVPIVPTWTFRADLYFILKFGKCRNTRPVTKSPQLNLISSGITVADTSPEAAMMTPW